MYDKDVKIGMRVQLNEETLGFSGSGEVIGIASSFPGMSVWVTLLDEPLSNFDSPFHGLMRGARGVTLTASLFDPEEDSPAPSMTPYEVASSWGYSPGTPAYNAVLALSCGDLEETGRLAAEALEALEALENQGVTEQGVTGSISFKGDTYTASSVGATSLPVKNSINLLPEKDSEK